MNDVVLEDFHVAEAFSKEHYAETIRSMERPYITRIRSVPVIQSVKSVNNQVGYKPIIRAIRGYAEINEHR